MATPRRNAEHQPAQAAWYGLLLTQGTLLTTGLQLANVAVVFPFVCAEEGAYWAAGLLYSAYSFGIVLGYFVTPFVLHRTCHLKHLVVAGSTAAMSVLVLVSAVAARTDVLVAFVFLTSSLIIGTVSAVSKVAYSDMISDKLGQIRRSDLILTQGAFGALTAIFTALLLLPLLARRDSGHSHLDVLWLGASGLAVAAITASLVGPARSSAANDVPANFYRAYREAASYAFSQRWFHRCALVQLFFVPVSLGVSFYSIHATLKLDTAGSLLVSSSLGLVVGCVFWRFVNRALGARGMLVISALLASLAALICVAIESANWQHVWLYGLVMFLATAANQAVFAATLSWIAACTPERHRASMIGFAELIVALGSSLLGAALGVIAHASAVLVPVIALLGLNVAAAVAARRMVPDRESLTAQAVPQTTHSGAFN